MPCLGTKSGTIQDISDIFEDNNSSPDKTFNSTFSEVLSVKYL